MKKILILNGPNLNMLGKREPELYGHQTLKDIEKLCADTARRYQMKIDFRQSNHEGELVTWIQNMMGKVDGIIINAAAYTHTSLAIHDALKLLKVPVIEVHLSDPSRREEFRHRSYVAMAAKGSVVGLGFTGYRRAMELLMALAE